MGSRRDMLPDDRLLKVDQVCDAFESAWSQGEAPSISDVIRDADEDIRIAILEELIPIDLAYRQRAGQKIHADDYHERFPELDSDWLTECFMVQLSADGLPTNSTIDFDAEEFPGDSFEKSGIDYSEFKAGVGQLLEQLVSQEIIESRTIEQHLDELKLATPENAASTLCELNVLTKFQADRLVAKNVLALTLNDYVLLEPLGQGGMGIVYKARHRRMDRIVALKTLHQRAVENEDALDRFRREVKAAARLTHPNIVQSFDAGEFDGVHYLVMEYVEGIDFSRAIKETGTISARRSVHYIAQAAKGLSYAHKQGVIHRDIKPQNLLVDDEHKVRILDMGLARLNASDSINNPSSETSQLTKSGVIMGTVDFMAPEQAKNTKNANEQSDIYSLGCTLHFLLTGRTMYQGETFAERMLAHHNDPQPSLTAMNPRIPQVVEDVFFRMTAKQPSDRFESMEHVEKELIKIFKQLNSKETGGLEVASSPAEKINQSKIQQTKQDSQAAAQARIIAPLPPDVEHDRPVPTTEVSVQEPFQDEALIQDDSPSFEPASARAQKESPGQQKSSQLKTMIAGGAIGLVVLICVIAFWPDTSGVRRNGGDNGSDNLKPQYLTLTDRNQPQYDWPDAQRAATQQAQLAKQYGLTPFVKNSIDMELAFIPADRDQAGFLMSTTEVTAQQFGEFYDEANYELQSVERFGRVGNRWEPGLQYDFRNLGLPPNPKLPAASICFFDAQAFCDWLSEKEQARYRLPTIAEWEFANMALATTDFFWGNESSDAFNHAWLSENSNGLFHTVATKSPNAFGLFDTVGNEAEWCGDGTEWANGEFNAEARDKDDDSPRPQLGGSFSTSSQELRNLHSSRNPFSGQHGVFRVIRELDP